MSSRSSKKPTRAEETPRAASFDRPGERLIGIGELSGTHGLRGELRLRPYNPGSTVLETVREVLLSAGGSTWRRVDLKRVRRSGRFWLLGLESVTSIDDARALVGQEVAVREGDLAPLSPGEFYQYQLVGLPVVDEAGGSLGSVQEVVSVGGNDVLVVDGAGKERMIPMVDEILRVVDLEARRIVVRPIAGLLDP